MRGRSTSWLAALLGLALCGSGCSGGIHGREPTAVAKSPGSPATPAWLPPYTPAQLALLKVGDQPIQVPAYRVFPDLERFGYSNNRRMEDVRESVSFTRYVATQLRDSPRFYYLDQAAAELANTIAQYGPAPAPEADGWMIAIVDQDGIGKLVKADASAAARADFDRGTAAFAAKDVPGAVAAFRDALAKSPKVPAIALSLAEAVAASGDAAAAKKAYEDALAIDPTFSSAHRSYAELLLKSGDSLAARREAVEALAYQPSSKKALEAADDVSFGAASAGARRVKPYPIFIDVDPVGAIHVAAAPDNPAQMYASCRAVLRYEPEVRSAIFEQPAETPYYLSVVEEVVCIETAIGAYLLDQNDKPQTQAPSGDGPIETLLKMAQEDGLSGYAMFEILGQHRPERARTAPPDVHRAMVEYVERYVLGGAAAAAPAGTYTAMR